MQSINLSIVTTSNFAPLLAEISSLEARLKSLNTLTAKAGSGFTSTQAVKELKNLKAAYHETMMASKGFQATEFTATTSAQLLTKRLATNTLSMKDYSAALKTATSESNIFNLAGQRQIAVQNSNLMVTGKTATAYTALSVDMTNATIKSQVYTQAILAQKAALTQLATNIVNAGKNMQWAGRQLTAGLTMPAAMMGAGAAMMFNTIDKNLTRLAKVYGVGLMEPTVQELANVRKEVLALGVDLSKTLGISTNEVTDIAAQFAAAGLTGAKLISATKQASRMVVLGEIDKQGAINATISLQTAYKLNTEQLTESVNFFNAAQAATSTSMADLVEAVPRTGPVIRGLGGTYKDMVALLVAMKEGGVPAAEGANAIKNSMGRLINPTKAAQDRLRGFGIDIKQIVTKNAGNLIGMVTSLQSSLDKLPSLQRQQAISELFGKFQFARMAALMDNFNRTGTQSAKIVEMMGMSAGSLSAIADKQTKKIQQSASGQFKIAVETMKNALIPFGQTMLEVATKIIKAIEKIVKGIEGLPGPIKNILKIGAAIALIAGPVLMIGGLLKNLFGNLLMKIGIPIISVVKALQAGVNPITALTSKFRPLKVEEELAAAASKKFAGAMNKVIDVNGLMISGIEKQIAMIDRLVLSLENAVVAETALSGVSAGTSERSITPTQSAAIQNTLSGAMSSGSYITMGQGAAGKISGASRWHVAPSSLVQGETKAIRDQRSALFQRVLPTELAGANLEKLNTRLGNKPIIYSNAAEQEATQKLLISKGLSQSAVEALMPALSSQTVIKIASTRLATLQAISKLPQDLQKQLNTKLGEILKAPVQNEAQRAAMLKQATDSFIAKNSTQIKAIESATSRATNAMLKIISNPNLTQAEKNQQLATYGQKEMMKLEDKLSSSFLGATNQGATSVALSTGIPAPSAIEKSIRRQQEKLLKETMYQQKQQQILLTTPPATPATPDNKEPKTRNMGRNLGAGAMAGSMALMMGGSAVGGTAGNVMATGGQSLMMGGMAASMLPASMMAGPIGPAIIGLAVALPFVIKGIKALQESAERFSKSMINSMKTSTLEVETFGIKINDIGNFSFPKITKEAQDSANAVDAIVQKIKQLDKADPLAQMVESMKKLSDSEVMSVIKQKYLTLRVQGVDEKAARDFVTATLRAAGKEIAVGSGFNAYAGTVENKSTSQMINDLYSNAKFISNMPAAGLRQTDLARGLADRSNKEKASQLAQTLFDVGSNLNSQGKASEFAKIIHDLTSNLKEGSAAAEGFKLTVEELYGKMGFSDAYNKFKANNVNAADSLMLIQLKAMGLNVDLDKLSKEPWRIKIALEYGQQVMAAQDVVTAQQSLFNNAKLKVLPTDNSFQETPDEKAAKKVIKKQIKAQELVVKAQELVVSNLEKEQRLRNNIADAQKRELDYAKSKADIQGQIQEALASGNVGKAVSLQNDLNAATANYNKELQTASDQRKIDIEKDKVDVQKNKLDAIKNKLDLLTNNAATTSTAAGKSAMKSYQDVGKQVVEEISKTIKVSDSDIKKWTNDLNPYVENSSTLVKDLIANYQQSPGNNLANSVVASMSIIVDANQRGIISAAIYNEIASGKYSSTANAVKAALDAVAPSLQAQITNSGKSVTVLGPATPGLPGGPGRKSVNISDLAQSSQYLNPSYDPRMKKANGGQIIGPGNGISDSIPAYLSNGEYVIRASAVKQYGKGLFDNLNSQNFANGGYILPKYHSGGKVGYKYGGEVMAMLQGGEVVIPKEIVRHYENGGQVSNSNSSQYNINVSVNGSNASADEIAKTVMRTIQNQQHMISGPRYV